MLEGGYDLGALRAAVPAVLDELAGDALADAIATPQPRGAGAGAGARGAGAVLGAAAVIGSRFAPVSTLLFLPLKPRTQ